MRGFSSEAIVFCLSSPLFLNSSSSRTQVRGTEMSSRRCILPGAADWSWKLHPSELCLHNYDGTELCWARLAMKVPVFIYVVSPERSQPCLPYHR